MVSSSEEHTAAGSRHRVDLSSPNTRPEVVRWKRILETEGSSLGVIAPSASGGSGVEGQKESCSVVESAQPINQPCVARASCRGTHRGSGRAHGHPATPHGPCRVTHNHHDPDTDRSPTRLPIARPAESTRVGGRAVKLDARHQVGVALTPAAAREQVRTLNGRPEWPSAPRNKTAARQQLAGCLQKNTKPQRAVAPIFLSGTASSAFACNNALARSQDMDNSNHPAPVISSSLRRHSSPVTNSTNNMSPRSRRASAPFSSRSPIPTRRNSAPAFHQTLGGLVQVAYDKNFALAREEDTPLRKMLLQRCMWRGLQDTFFRPGVDVDALAATPISDFDSELLDTSDLDGEADDEDADPLDDFEMHTSSPLEVPCPSHYRPTCVDHDEAHSCDSALGDMSYCDLDHPAHAPHVTFDLTEAKGHQHSPGAHDPEDFELSHAYSVQSQAPHRHVIIS
ncbi:uncharacterized protein MONBRDRAFT_4747 [Monosiga brevicollis MX1]|uniref:Uncharacterized protein n=1 Tax=Monosiga brevicollis TaxID=81824 RepID=A9UNT9_MONBE|nr:uncharacterized protein MONBRDRAFT_4747 [Monosiga brevicollis MX1]EDQ92758.1 predicted protein [Monosiga brevicollis MX1]|eukprot:XP_001742520.1 hypothetical protein [Monosiga brevicollis MX1]